MFALWEDVPFCKGSVFLCAIFLTFDLFFYYSSSITRLSERCTGSSDPARFERPVLGPHHQRA